MSRPFRDDLAERRAAHRRIEATVPGAADYICWECADDWPCPDSAFLDRVERLVVKVDWSIDELYRTSGFDETNDERIGEVVSALRAALHETPE